MEVGWINRGILDNASFSTILSCSPLQTLHGFKKQSKIFLQWWLNPWMLIWLVLFMSGKLWQPLSKRLIWRHQVLLWLNSGILPSLVNHTFITLIPKVDSPELVTEFQPISLCIVLYKVFSKVLANHLKNPYQPLILKINL